MAQGGYVTAGGIWAVVPAKDLAQAKRRLGSLLTLVERQALARAMLEDVLGILTDVPNLSGAVVVTRDAELATIGRSFGARIVSDLRHEGPNAAVSLAANRLAAEGAAGMVAIPADVPLASGLEVAEILATMRAAPAVTLVPALADMGSNGVALAPIDAIPFCFGKHSFFRHQEAALARGIEPRLLRLPGLGLDVDRPEDLAAFVARPSATRSYACLEEFGIVRRIDTAVSVLPAEDAGRGTR